MSIALYKLDGFILRRRILVAILLAILFSHIFKNSEYQKTRFGEGRKYDISIGYTSLIKHRNQIENYEHQLPPLLIWEESHSSTKSKLLPLLWWLLYAGYCSKPFISINFPRSLIKEILSSFYPDFTDEKMKYRKVKFKKLVSG